MKKKFTLIELIIVIVVIGILAAMAMPKFNGVVREAKLSAMINDKEVLEKTMLLYYQKYDKLPLLNKDQELIVLDNDISLIKMVQAEEAQNNDMKTIYTSLQETLKYYNDNEENLYRIDINEINNSLSKKLKYGHKKEEKDFYVYSTKTNNVYYYNTMLNGDGEIQHSEFNTKFKTSELVDKNFSYNLSDSGSIINNKPIVELTTNLSNITTNSLIKWEYIFTNEDKEPTKISFILNNVEYDSFDKIPTQLGDGEYTIKLKMQDSKGLWSDEIVKEFKIKTTIEQSFKDIVYVKATGTNVIENGTKENPYETLEYALTQVKDNGTIYIDGKIQLKTEIDFDNYKKNVNFIGDYKNNRSEVYIANTNYPHGDFITRSYNVSFNGIKFLNERSRDYGETFCLSDNLVLNNCILKDSSGYSNVYGKYILNNCVIERMGAVYSPTTFNNCVFLNEFVSGDVTILNSLRNCTLDENYNITSNHNWINTGIDIDGNKTNIGVYGGKYLWK